MVVNPENITLRLVTYGIPIFEEVDLISKSTVDPVFNIIVTRSSFVLFRENVFRKCSWIFEFIRSFVLLFELQLQPVAPSCKRLWFAHQLHRSCGVHCPRWWSVCRENIWIGCRWVQVRWIGFWSFQISAFFTFKAKLGLVWREIRRSHLQLGTSKMNWVLKLSDQRFFHV